MNIPKNPDNIYAEHWKSQPAAQPPPSMNERASVAAATADTTQKFVFNCPN